MEIGFNFKTHKIEEMEDYEVITDVFNFNEEYMAAVLEQGANNLIEFYSSIADNLKPNTNYSIVIKLLNEEPIDYYEYFTLFSSFGFILAAKGQPNDKGYLAVRQDMRAQMVCTDYTMLNLLNKDFELGTIQLIFEDSEGYFVKWINHVS